MNYTLFGDEIKQTLKEKYLIHPFSVIDASTQQFRNRNKKYIELGIKSEIGRDSIVYHGSSTKSKLKLDEYRKNWSDGSNIFYNRLTMNNGISIFSPFLCEIMYDWFCIEGGNILDPFAGGSVRGIVANYLGYNYTGIELRKEQVDSNRHQAKDILPRNKQPLWYIGDSDKILDEIANNKYDLVFTCPPYFNLEVYSDLPDDISNMRYDMFIKKYASIIKKSCALLNTGGFAIFVISDVRKTLKTGYSSGYVGLVKDTINIFMNLGMEYWNDIILLNNTGNAGIRCNKYMKRKIVVRVHQNILVFKKV